MQKNSLKDNEHTSLHLARKYAWIFVLGHYLFLGAHSFTVHFLKQIMSPDKKKFCTKLMLLFIYLSFRSFNLKNQVSELFQRCSGHKYFGIFVWVTECDVCFIIKNVDHHRYMYLMLWNNFKKCLDWFIFLKYEFFQI